MLILQEMSSTLSNSMGHARSKFLALLSSIVAFVASFGSVWAQPGYPFISNFPASAYYSEDYPSGLQNWCVVQGPLGMMFVCNMDVSLMYNGKRWTEIEGSEGMVFRKMASAMDGKVYTGGINSLGYIAPTRNGGLSFVSLFDHLPPNSKQFDKIFNVAADNQGLVVFLNKQWLFVWDGQSFRTWESKVAFEKAFNVGGKIVVQCKDDGLWLVQNASIHKISESGVLDTFSIKGIHARDPNVLQNAVFATKSQGFFTFAEDKFYRFDSLGYEPVIWNTVSLSDHELACATESHGLLILNTNSKRIEAIDEQQGLFFNSVLFPAKDAEGGVWMATQNGLSRLQYPSNLWKTELIDKRRFVAASIISYQRKMLVGSLDGVRFFDKNNPQTQGQKIPEITDFVRAFANYEDALLMGTPNNGIQIFQGSSRSQISDLSCYALKVSKSHPGRLYVGNENGLFSLFLKDEQWIEEGRVLGIDHNVCHIEEMSNGDLWVGWTEVSSVHFEAGDFAKPIVTSYDSTDGFSRDHVEFELLKYGEKLYFCTNRGFSSFDERLGKLVADSTFGARFADQGHGARHATQDLLGQIWLYDGERTGFLKKDAAGKWQWNDLPLRRMEDQTVWCIYPDPDSLIWIGTTSTLYCYDPRIPKDYHVPFHTLIDRVTLDDSNVVFYGNYADAQGLITDIQPDAYKLTFPYGHNEIKFSYTATSYEYPEKTVYSHWLEGLEEDWSPWGAASDKVYNGLPEGHYTFHVRSRNLYDTLGKEAAYSFTILPPWYRTWWAYLCYGALAVGVVALIVRWQVRRAVHKQEVARAGERKQQRDMLQATVDAQEKERGRIARDLHDDIQVTLATVKLELTKIGRKIKKEGLDDDLTTRPTDLVQDAIESIRNISKDLMPVSLEQLGLARTLNEICKKINVGEGLQVHFVVDGVDKRLHFETELAVFRVAQELLANGLKHAEASEIHLRLSFEAQAVTMTYQDNGKGFDATLLAHTGLGFKNIESRLSLVGGEFSYESAPGNGCRFVVRVPDVGRV